MIHQDAPPIELAVAVTAATLSEAELLCALLRAEGIDAFVPNSHSTNVLMHASLGLNPRGVQVMVQAEDVEPAKEVLAELRAEPDTEVFEAPDNTADQYARSAYYAAVCSLIMVLFVPLTFWYYFRAQAAAQREAPADPQRFHRHMKWAVIMMIAMTVLIAAMSLFFASLRWMADGRPFDGGRWW